MSNEERARLRAGNFVHNNGLVLRIINILRYKYNRLTGVKDVVAGLSLIHISEPTRPY